MPGFGTMQGRLTPPHGRGMQFFPFDNWKEEFFAAEKIGLDEIEWLLDDDRQEENPIQTKQGILEIKKTLEITSVKVNSLCLHYFVKHPFYKLNGEEKKACYQQNCETIERALYGLAEIGGKILEIPVLDSASIKIPEEEKEGIEFIAKIAGKAAEYNINLVLETDFPPGRFRKFLDKIKGEFVYATFDSGNSSGLGYDAGEEITSLEGYIRNVHIKDRVYQGTTVELGAGSADFDKVFLELKHIGYKYSFILEAARGKDGMEQETIARQFEFMKRYVEKYSL